MSEPPLVSVGVPVYNGEAYLARALEALLAQDHPNLEIVVSDNCSTDATPAILEKYAALDPRIRYVRGDRNRGVSWNFNNALALATGDYFMWHAADDVALPSHVSRCVEALRSRPDAIVAFAKVGLIDAAGDVIGRLDDEGLDFTSLGPGARVDLYLRREVYQVIGYGGVVRTAELRALGGHPIYSGGDVTLGIALALRGTWVQVPETLFLQRRHDQQVHRDQGRDVVAQVRAHRPDFGRPVAFPQWYLNHRNLRETLVAPVSPVERAKAFGYVLRDWTLPNWRSFPVDIKRNLRRLRAGGR